MAWTDAARAAALTARRAHSVAKSEARSFALGVTPFMREVAVVAENRRRMAKHLRAFRAGGKAMRASMKKGYSMHSTALSPSIFREAATSTAIRNMYFRNKKRR